MSAMVAALFLLAGAEGAMGLHVCPVHDSVAAGHSHHRSTPDRTAADHHHHELTSLPGAATPGPAPHEAGGDGNGAHHHGEDAYVLAPAVACDDDEAAPCPAESHGESCTCLGACHAAAGVQPLPAPRLDAEPEAFEVPSAPEPAVSPASPRDSPHFLPYALAPPVHG